MDWLNKNHGEVSSGVSTKPSVFTFVPVVQKLPIKSLITEDGRSEALTRHLYKIVSASHEERTLEAMSDKDMFKAERVFIKESAEGGAGSLTKVEMDARQKLPPDHGGFSQSKLSPPVRAQSENTLSHAAAAAARTAAMETAVDKHGSISQRPRQRASGHSEVSLGCFAHSRSASEDRMSPTNSADLFPTPASSRESILSESWDREKSCSTVPLSSVTSPVSFSRTVSPCSSVLSGIFAPAVVQIKRHFLAPGSSLVNVAQSCFSSSESLSSSLHSSPPRHRPPVTRLSLLTAILRKGRLPVLSSALQRPYTPCWPVNPVTLSFCNACSAASSVASIPIEFSSRFSSSTSIDSQREADRCTTAPPTVHPIPPTQVDRCSEQPRSSSAPKWDNAVLPEKRFAPLPVFSSNFQSVPPPKCEDCATPQKLSHTSKFISQSSEPKPSGAHVFPEGHTGSNLRKTLVCPPTKLSNQTDIAAAPRKWNPQPISSLSKLHSLSQRLRSPPHLQHSHSCNTVFPPSPSSSSPLPPAQNPAQRPLPERSCLISKSATAPQGFPKPPNCLSPSRYTPIVFSGWPSPTCTPTPTPSPAPPFRDLSPSPSLSLRSTPSPRPGSGISDCSDREGKKRKTHKIKSSYKSLAAIPTNTLLLDQQAIDDQIERQQDDRSTPDGGLADTHAEMCSPAQLRQQSEELYAVIDEVLANSIPESSRSSTPNTGLQQSSSSFPKSLGRETKYASVCSLYPSSAGRKGMNAKTTKPGVIRPMTAIPRLTVEEDENRFNPKPFRPSAVKQTLTDKKKVETASPRQAGIDLSTGSKGVMWGEKRKPERTSPFSVCELQITEPDEEISHSGKDVLTSFSPAERRMDVFETHI